MWRFLKRLLKWLLWSFGVLVAFVIVIAVFTGPPEKDSQTEPAARAPAPSNPEPVESVDAKPAAESVSPTNTTPAPPQTPKPVAVKPPVIDPAQQKYNVMKEKDHSFGKRLRITLEIEAPQAKTDQDIIGAMMVAAVDRHRTDWPHAVSARLWKSYEKDQTIHNRITYAPDGCGWAGDQCTGGLWSELHRGEVPQELIEWGKPTDEEEAAGKEKACRQDLGCWGEKHAMAATFACQPLIEGSAKYDYEWTDGWLGVKLPRFRWKDRKAGTLSYTGDKIKFQNGFGAWQHAVYWCHFNPTTETVSVEVYPK